ncbi:hypothetical protein [Klebsiella aerogenes]|uniref:hypothetical protein n=1 Tax=Klebsiella aerogenes TaxID=548 RepID=UPI0013D4A0FC|nr:hypothetical protein [Klebsiella aerogenes]
MSIKPVSDLYLITYEDGSPYKSTRDAKEAVDAIGAGFKVEEFVSLENHRAAMLQAEPVTTANKLGNSPVIPDGSKNCPCCGKRLRRSCSVEACGGKHVAHGLCQKHYDMKRWEDPEQVRKFREAGKRYRRKKKSAAADPQEVNHG